jgi:hypothetical protein
MHLMVRHACPPGNLSAKLYDNLAPAAAKIKLR